MQVEQVARLHVHVVALAVDLVRAVAQHGVELGLRRGDQVGVRHPRAVEAVSGLALLVGRHLLDRTRRHLGVAAVRDERTHAADREGSALVARLHEQVGVGPHERHRHRDLAAVGEHEARPAATVVLDDREDVVPAPGVQARAVVAQLVQDLVHLERGRQRLDQHGGADGAVRDADVLLAEREDVVPQLRLLARLQLRDVEVRASPGLDQRLCVVQEVETEVDQRPGCRGATAGPVDEGDVLLGQVPAAGAHHDRGRALRGDAVLLAGSGFGGGGGEGEFSSDRVLEGELTLDDVLPGGTRGVLLVGEPDAGAGVERVDGHLRVGGSGDLHAAVLEAGPGTGDPPVPVLADVGRVVAELRVVPVADLEASAHPVGEPVVTAGREPMVQLGEEGDRLRREDLLVAVADGAGDLDRRTLLGRLDRCRGGRGSGHDESLYVGVLIRRDPRWSPRPNAADDRGGGSRRRGWVSARRERSGDQWNCAASVEPARARVALSGLSAVEMTSK